jgi:TetR/AcrR family transcriptional repressor of nem operon
MARQKTFDEDDVLADAMSLFWKCGYEATSIRDLTGHLGISNSSLYATFGDKHEVFLAALARYREIEFEHVRETLRSAESVRDALGQIFSELISNLLADENRRGSFTLNAAVELGGRDPAVTAQLQAHFDDITLLLASHLADGQTKGEITLAHKPADMAQFVLNSLFSLAGVAKVNPNRTYMETIARLTLAIIIPINQELTP